MRSTLEYEQKQNHFYAGTAVLIILLLGGGVFFRCCNLDKKIYWFDEIVTSVRISGYSREEVKRELFTAGDITVHDIQKYQRIEPERTVLHTIGSLAMEDPKHPPLYFILARLWAELFGDSVATIRSLSVFISLLAIPSFYWLAHELFGSGPTVWTAIVLMAVSPFHVLYAQEARPYSLWILMTLLSSAALLRALRMKSGRHWGLYALTLIGGIYTHILFGLVAAGHGIYVASLTRLSLKKCSRYFIATFAALAAFLPWAFFIFFRLSRLEHHNGWITTTEVGLLDTFKRWTLVFSSLFIDTGGADILRANFGFVHSWIHWIRLPVLLIVAYALYFLYRNTPGRTSLFVLALTGSTVIPLILLDVTLGWQISAHPRFLVPYYLGSLLAVAYLLAAQFASQSVSKRRVWQTITIILISGGVVSCAIISRVETWWNKGGAENSPQVARLISQTSRPLLVATSDSAGFFTVSSLSHSLDPKVSIRWLTDPNTLQISDRFTDVYLSNPPDHLRQRFENNGNYRVERVLIARKLWRLTRMP